MELVPAARERPNSGAMLAWADGMLAVDPMVRLERLRRAVEGFRNVGRLVDEARCLLDLASLLDAEGDGGTAERERARALLEERGIVAFTGATRGA